jgi:predicted DNA-binding transcriptional regulator YafY
LPPAEGSAFGVVTDIYLGQVNRTDRLYALVEELRAIAPRPRSTRWLARRFEVSARTIERDVSALAQSGVPVWAQPGRSGGYCLDKQRTLPPVNFTPGEAMALAVALRNLAGTPFGQDGAAAMRKVLAVMRKEDAETARDLMARVYLVGDADPPPLPAAITDALPAGRVLRIGYADRHGVVTRRDIEPLGYVCSAGRWYLLAWCRLRDAVRVFRTDRIATVTFTAQTVAPRALRREDLDIPQEKLRPLVLD